MWTVEISETLKNELLFNESDNMYSLNFEYVTMLHTSTPLSTKSHSSASNNSESGFQLLALWISFNVKIN